MTNNRSACFHLTSGIAAPGRARRHCTRKSAPARRLARAAVLAAICLCLLPFPGTSAFANAESQTAVSCMAEGFRLEPVNGGYAVAGYMGRDRAAAIPEEANGLPVVVIQEGAFSDCFSLTAIRIPASVKEIAPGAFTGVHRLEHIIVDDANRSFTVVDGVLFDARQSRLICYPTGKTDDSYQIPQGVKTIAASAFRDCDRLTGITLPGSVKTIEAEAFYDCDKLTGIEIPKGVESIGERAFYHCDRLASFSLPASVKELGADAFGETHLLEEMIVDPSNPLCTVVDGVLYNKQKTALLRFPSCTEIRNYQIPEGVVTIDDQAFLSWNGLNRLTLPASLTNIENGALAALSSLKEIAADAANPAYTVVDGVLFDRGQTELIRYPALMEGSSYRIPEGVTTIANGAFSDCTDLTSITIPGGVTAIGDDAFAFCDDLTGITIPGGVTAIGDDAFAFCDDLTLTVAPGSYGEQYAIRNELRYTSK